MKHAKPVTALALLGSLGMVTITQSAPHQATPATSKKANATPRRVVLGDHVSYVELPAGWQHQGVVKSQQPKEGDIKPGTMDTFIYKGNASTSINIVIGTLPKRYNVRQRIVVPQKGEVGTPYTLGGLSGFKKPTRKGDGFPVSLVASKGQKLYAFVITKKAQAAPGADALTRSFHPR